MSVGGCVADCASVPYVVSRERGRRMEPRSERSLPRCPKWVWSPFPEGLSSAPHLSVGRLLPSPDSPSSLPAAAGSQRYVFVSEAVCANSCDSTARRRSLLVPVPRGYSGLCDLGLPVASLGLRVSSVSGVGVVGKVRGVMRAHGAGSVHHVPGPPAPARSLTL